MNDGRGPYSGFSAGYRVDLGDDDLEPIVFVPVNRPSSLKGRAIRKRHDRDPLPELPLTRRGGGVIRQLFRWAQIASVRRHYAKSLRHLARRGVL